MDHWVRVLLQDGLFDRSGMPDYIYQGLERAARIIEAMEPYRFRTDTLEEISDALSECTEISELSAQMWNAAVSTGFENYIIFLLKNGSKGVMQSRVCTSCHSDWLARYQSQNYQFIDPVMAAAMQGDGVFEFADLKGSSPVVDAFWVDTQAHRIGHNGLCIVRTRADGTRIGVSFLTRKSESQTRSLVRLNGSDLVMIAELAMDAFCYASYSRSIEPEALSPEEARFLYLLATRKNPKDALQVVPPFGSNKSLQVSIRRKLGVETVFQAVSLATARGDLDYVPYEASEVTSPFQSFVGLDAATLASADPSDPWLECETVPGASS